MRWRSCALLALSACYAPNVIGGAPCDPGADSCPRGQTCTATSSGYFCSGGRTDGGTDSSGGEAGDFCLGNKLLGSVCLSRAPTTPVTYTTGATINTALATPGNCNDMRTQVGGPAFCLIAASSIEVASGAAVRAIGPHPVVLFAAQKITVAGTLDASSRFGETLDLKRVLGAGARTAADCNAIGVDGTTSTNPDNGGGGAAGGSFGGAGGAGGNGRNGVPRGNPRPASTATVLVGGCPGGHGGDGAGGAGGGGIGGNAGGAIYLLAGDSIIVTGRINGSGAGGDPGIAGFDSSGGGGGGGAGGMIALEAPQITVSGVLIANGGGGGGGGGDQPNRPGQPGSDPMAPGTAAPGGSGGNGGGGNGGNGSTASLVGANAGSAGSNFACAGGGGGGGGGIVHLYGAATTPGMVSPPPTN